MENQGLTSGLNKKTTTGLVVLMIVYLVFRFLGPVILSALSPNLSTLDYSEILSTRGTLQFVYAVVNEGINIAIGVFLIFQAKDAKYHRTLWFCLGAIFGMIALILFYIFRIYDNTKSNNE